MKINWKLILIPAGFIAYLAVRKNASSQSTINHQPSTFVLTGDSLGVGLASPLKQAGVNLLGSQVKIGTTIQYWASGAGNLGLKQLLSLKPKYVLVSLGTNDAYAGVSYSSIAQSAATILMNQVEASGAKVIWIGPPTLPSGYSGNTLSQGTLSDIRDAVSQNPNAQWIDSTNLNIERSSDNLHPTGNGYQSWAQSLAQTLSKV